MGCSLAIRVVLLSRKAAPSVLLIGAHMVAMQPAGAYSTLGRSGAADGRVRWLAPAISIVSGNDQAGRVYSPLTNYLVVKLTDAAGAAVPGEVVRASTAGVVIHGTVSPTERITDAQGLATFSWSIGGRTTAAGQRATIEWVATGLTVVFSATARFSWMATKPAGGRAHSCALAGGDNTGAVLYCWGANEYGQLGDGSAITRTAPRLVMLGTDTPLRAQQVIAGGDHTCVWSVPNYFLWCWGRNDAGQLGVGDNWHRSVPTRVQAPDGNTTRMPSAGDEHTCAVSAGSHLYCSGYNLNGELGDGTSYGRTVPTLVASYQFTHPAAGSHHTCALDGSRFVYCWGYNRQGQLGTNDRTDRHSPTKVVPPAGSASSMGFDYLTAGGVHTCGIAFVSRLAYCWGSGARGALGVSPQPTDAPQPRLVAGTRQWNVLAAGYYHTCGGEQGGSVFCWGANDLGQLGDGTTIDRKVPTATAFSAAAMRMVGAGYNHSCAIAQLDVTAPVTLYCWGSNSSRQLGISGTVFKKTPTLVPEPASP